MEFVEKRNTMYQMKFSLHEINNILDTCTRKGMWSWRYRMTNYPKWSREQKHCSHHHRHHLQKGVLGAGVPSCSDKTGKSSQSSLVPAPDGLPACARWSDQHLSQLQAGKETAGEGLTEGTNPEASKPQASGKAETSSQRREAIFQHGDKKTNFVWLVLSFIWETHVLIGQVFSHVVTYTFCVGKGRGSRIRKQRGRAALRAENTGRRKLGRKWEREKNIWSSHVTYTMIKNIKRNSDSSIRQILI